MKEKAMETPNGFYMTYREDGNAPKIKHASLGTAMAEAERIARKEKIRVYLLKAVAVVDTLPSPVKWTALEE